MNLDLNGATAFAESIKQQLGNVRRDWRVEAAEMRAQFAESKLEIERLKAQARDVQAKALEVIASIKPARDGIDGSNGIDGKDGAPGRDGKDVDPALIERLVVNAVAQLPKPKDGEDGKDGANGRDADPALIERLVVEAAAKIEKPKDGRDGVDGKDGANGKDGAPGTFKIPKLFQPGQISYAGELVYFEGSTFAAIRDSANKPPHEDFQPVAFKGRDGTNGKDAYAGRALGLYDEKRTDYRAMDVVVFNNSEWRAVCDNPGPLPGNGWVQGAKGSKGKPGDKGDRGDPGARGPAGVGFEKLELVETTLIVTRTDGSMLSVDLKDLESLFG